MKTEEYKNKVEKYVLHTYNRFPAVLEKGEGVYLYDSDGNKYLDFASGIAVCALGYGLEEYKNALKSQIDKITHTSNLFYNEPLAEASEKIVKSTGLSKVFFTNSGTEAIEGAIKAAKKYAYINDGIDDHEIIAMENSFHGRSVGALSITGNAHYHEGFKPLMDGVKFATFNDIESVKAKLTDKTCAIILEPIQGEGGIYPADSMFMKEIRQICDEKDILMIVDEIQCGMGRSGHMWAFQEYGIMPDILTSAKALGCGVPVGAFVLGEKAVAKSLVPGDHGTTYGGGPFVCAAVSAVFNIFEKKKIVENVNEVSAYFKKGLEELKAKHDCIEEIRGKGLMIGLQLSSKKPVGEVITAARENGMLVISAGNNVLRILPPLVITKENVDEALDILDKSF